MNLRLGSIETEQLLSMYKTLDAEVKQQLLDGGIWEDLKERVNYLNELSKELSKRKVSLQALSGTPADSNLRREPPQAAV